MLKIRHMYHRFNRYITLIAEYGIFSTINSAGQLIKMAVIWLETFHNQFDVSDRKRYILVHGTSMVLLRYIVFCLSTAFFVPYMSFSCVSLLFRRSLFIVFTSVLLITEARWNQTQFWSSKLAVIVELYDKPTLMVKVCPVFRQDAGARVFHEEKTNALSSLFFFFFMKIFNRWRPSISLFF